MLLRVKNFAIASKTQNILNIILLNHDLVKSLINLKTDPEPHRIIMDYVHKAGAIDLQTRKSKKSNKNFPQALLDEYIQQYPLGSYNTIVERTKKMFNLFILLEEKEFCSKLNGEDVKKLLTQTFFLREKFFYKIFEAFLKNGNNKAKKSFFKLSKVVIAILKRNFSRKALNFSNEYLRFFNLFADSANQFSINLENEFDSEENENNSEIQKNESWEDIDVSEYFSESSVLNKSTNNDSNNFDTIYSLHKQIDELKKERSKDKLRLYQKTKRIDQIFQFNEIWRKISEENEEKILKMQSEIEVKNSTIESLKNEMKMLEKKKSETHIIVQQEKNQVSGTKNFMHISSF